MHRFCEALELRTLLSAVEAVARPAYNTGTGFFVHQGVLYDANGIEFDIRGFNHTHWWGNHTNNLAAIAEFPKTKANTVRAVFGTGDFSGSATPAQRRDIVERYIAQGIVPMVEDHMATCETTGSPLRAVVDRWLHPDNVAWLRQHERHLMLNIANEWGPNSTVWRDEYKLAITRLRNADINCTIVIDAGGWCGQDIGSIKTWAQEVLNHDPQRNVLFSVHMYGFWRTGPWTGGGWTPPLDVLTELSAVRNAGIPIIVGEFSWTASDSVNYSTQAAVSIFNQLDIGWLAWSWNQNSDGTLDMVPGSNWAYTNDASLTDFGRFIINDPVVGLKATSRPATVFGEPPPPPPPPSYDATIGLTPVAPVIDGAVDANVWDDRTPRAITRTLVGTVSNDADLSGSWRMAFDASRLYLIVDVRDDAFSNDSTNPWDDDSVELYFDGDASRGPSYDGINDRQIVFGRGDAAPVAGASTPASAIQGVSFAFVDVPGGYRLEASVPLANLGITPGTRPAVGLDVHLNDDDNGGARDGKRSWHAQSDNVWSTPAGLALGKFVDDAVSPRASLAIDVETGLSFVLSPNEPLADQTPITLTGATLLNLATNETLDASTLAIAREGSVYRLTAGQIPADGRWRLTIPAGALMDEAGNRSLDVVSLDFHVLRGDVNRDRRVDFADLLILAQNYGQSGRTFSQGNVDYDATGTVGFGDLLIIAQNYGTQLITDRPAAKRDRSARLADSVIA